MSKEHVSATVDPEVAAYLGREGVNTSATINKAIKQQMGAASEEEGMLKLRLEQLNAEIENKEDSLQRAKQQRERVRQRLEEVRQQSIEELEEAKDAFSNVPPKDITEDNPAVNSWAEDLDMEVSELVGVLKDDDN